MSQVDPYETLRADIVSGRLPAGEPLAEVALAERLQVSRTPVREALRRLEQDGLVRRQGHRLVVYKRTPEETVDLFEIRQVLEACAARGAALRRTELDLARVDAAYRRMQDAEPVTLSPEDAAAMVLEFHRTIWAASHNASLQAVLDKLVTAMFGRPHSPAAHVEIWQESLDEHHRLLTVIQACDPEAAWQEATTHIDAARRRELHELMLIEQEGERDAPPGGACF